MVFKRLKDALTRPPIPAERKTLPQAEETSWEVHARKSILTIGHKDSAIPLTQLAMLRDAVMVRPETARGIVIGIPFDRVERTLAAAGFNTAENLLSLTLTRHILRFENPADGTTWHLNATEFGRSGAAPEFEPGMRYEIPPDFVFNDWRPGATPGAMRSRTTGREASRPASLVFRHSFASPGIGGYDCLTGELPPEEILSRLRTFGALGLNAFLFLKNLITLLRLTGREIDTPLLCRLVTDTGARELELEYLATILAGLDSLSHATACDVLATLREIRDNVPPMAMNLVLELEPAAYLGRTLHPIDDFLTPGKIWHITTDTQANKYIANGIKRDLQRQLLATPPGDDTTLIFLGEWNDHVEPALDGACLDRPDITLGYAVTRSDLLIERHGEAPIHNLTRAFPRHAWHITTHDTDFELFDKTYPFVAHSRQQLAFLNWENRLHETEGRIRETSIELNIDGQEVHERSKRSKLKRSIERGGYALD